MWDVQIATVDEDLKMTVEKWPVVQAFGYDEWLDLDETQIHICVFASGWEGSEGSTIEAIQWLRILSR